MTYQQRAIDRLQAVSYSYQSQSMADDDKEAVPMILADLIHYCKAKGISFDSAYNEAKKFVTEDLSFDTEELLRKNASSDSLIAQHSTMRHLLLRKFEPRG